MNKILITYFSASGITKNIANKIKNATNGDLFEIEPVNKYTEDDLDWTNEDSRSSREMHNKNSRPKIKNKVSNIDDYNIILIGFPIWWDLAPTIINSFIEENNLNNKNIYVYATSGSSSIDNSFNDLKKTYSNLNFIKGKRFIGIETENDISNWLN